MTVLTDLLVTALSTWLILSMPFGLLLVASHIVGARADKR